MRATLFVLLCACATASGSRDDVERGITFIEDDYAAALNEAKARHLPLFVDAWAPWCHSCVFLKEHVLKDPAFARNQKRYVFLSIDTEKEKSAAFLEKFPIEAWPTLFVVDPATEQPVLKWLGTGTVAQLDKLLDDGEVALRAKEGADPVALLAKADTLYAARKIDEAAQAYEAAFVAMGADHPRRARTLESWINALSRSQRVEQCAKAGAHASSLPRGPSFVNAVSLSLTCVVVADAKAAWRADAVTTLKPLAEEALKLDGVLADDKSGIYELLVDLKEDPAEHKALALVWLQFLEGEAARAPTPAARAVFDSHRLGAALEAKEPQRVEAALLQSEKDLPQDYNPPARLAVVYRELGRYDDALAAVERGFTRAYGPRKLRLFETKASILAKKGDTAAQRATLIEAVAYGRGLPAPQRPEGTLKRLEAEANKLAK